jgi:hypothetical protein
VVDQQQSNHKEEGEEYVIETKGKWNYRVPCYRRPGDADGRNFGKERGA